jgi:tape measure domain-containing protein
MAVPGEVIINTRLMGWREVVAGLQAEAESLIELGAASMTAGRAMKETNERSFVLNQGVFTARRVLYAGSLAFLAMGAAALKMGWDFNSAMQTSMVALKPVLGSVRATRNELNYLFRQSAFTPFQFKDITIAFRQMLAGFKGTGLSVKETNQALFAMIDALSYAGRTSPGALNRVSVALQHMMNLGHITGQTINQLSRDGIQISQALRKELGLSQDQIHNIGRMNIDSATAMRAIVKYIETTPGFMRAAFRQATQTLQGAFTTFKDLLSQAVGNAQSGLFGGVTKFFQSVDLALKPVYSRKNQPVTLFDMAKAIDQVVSPKSHAMMNLFHDIGTALQSLGQIFHSLFQTFKESRAIWTGVAVAFGVLNIALQTFNWLLGQGLGPVLGGVVGYMIIFETASLVIIGVTRTWRALLIGVKVALIAWKIAEIGALVVQYLLIRAQIWWNAVTAEGTVVREASRLELVFWNAVVKTGTALMWLLSLATSADARAQLWANIQFAIARARVVAAAIATALYTVAMNLLTGSTIDLAITTGVLTDALSALGVAIMAVPVIGWVIALITLLVVLYFRWGAFHRLVNRIFDWIKDHWKLLALILVSPFAVLGYEVVKHFDWIKNKINSFWNWLKNIFHEVLTVKVRFSFPGSGILNKILTVEKYTNPVTAPFFIGKKLFDWSGLAGGGTALSPGYAMVGEHGPEVVHLPMGASVVPLNRSTAYNEGWGSGMSLQIEVYPQQIMLDGRVLAESIAQVKTNLEARR